MVNITFPGFWDLVHWQASLGGGFHFLRQVRSLFLHLWGINFGFRYIYIYVMNLFWSSFYLGGNQTCCPLELMSLSLISGLGRMSLLIVFHVPDWLFNSDFQVGKVELTWQLALPESPQPLPPRPQLGPQLRPLLLRWTKVCILVSWYPHRSFPVCVGQRFASKFTLHRNSTKHPKIDTLFISSCPVIPVSW